MECWCTTYGPETTAQIELQKLAVTVCGCEQAKRNCYTQLQTVLLVQLKVLFSQCT